ncbi:MAG: hypothetical protein WAZ62_05615, partial [Zavarzinia sp.]
RRPEPEAVAAPREEKMAERPREEKSERPREEKSERTRDFRDAPDRRDYNERRPPRRRDDDLGPSVIGFGDHVPAFILRPVYPVKDTGRANEA